MSIHLFSAVFLLACIASARAAYLPLGTPPRSAGAAIDGDEAVLTSVDGGFAADGVVVKLVRKGEDRQSVVLSSVKPISSVRLSWPVDFGSSATVLGDHWERTYGETYWRPIGVPRAMPWFFLVKEGERTDGYGVMTQPNAFACWRTDGRSLDLVIDVRAAGRPVRLNGRKLEAVTLVSRKGLVGKSAFAAGQSFCRMMCPAPRLPKEPVYGYNDWYCAYGKQTAEGYLRDAKEVVGLCVGLANRPYAVVDDGWQRQGGDRKVYGWGPWAWTKSRPGFGMEMPEFTARIAALGAKPGLWYRPLIAWPEADQAELQLDNGKAFDPTVPSVRARIASDIARFRSWGMKLVKVDFLTYDISGNWVCDRRDNADRLIIDDRRWRDDSRTTVEVMKDLYRTMREAAGDEMVIIGCNAINHLAAGLFEVQRTGDDTSGRKWGQTLRNGVNTLGMRAMMNRTFYQADPDCVGLAERDAVLWSLNAQWLDLVARSGTSLFVSWKAGLLSDEVRSALRTAFSAASVWRETAEPLDWETVPTPKRWQIGGQKEYNW